MVMIPLSLLFCFLFLTFNMYNYEDFFTDSTENRAHHKQTKCTSERALRWGLGNNGECGDAGSGVESGGVGGGVSVAPASGAREELEAWQEVPPAYPGSLRDAGGWW